MIYLCLICDTVNDALDEYFNAKYITQKYKNEKYAEQKMIERKMIERKKMMNILPVNC